MGTGSYKCLGGLQICVFCADFRSHCDNNSLLTSNDLASDLEWYIYGCDWFRDECNQESHRESIGPQVIGEQSLHSIGLKPSCEGLNVLPTSGRHSSYGASPVDLIGNLVGAAEIKHNVTSTREAVA